MAGFASLKGAFTVSRQLNCLAQGTQPFRSSKQVVSLACRRNTSTAPVSGSADRLRVAVVGGGVSGISTALHLAPLVSAGYIEGPIDVYETSQSRDGRKIGVGIWSTAIDPFLDSGHESHRSLYNSLVEKGCFVRDVGYRSPQGQWLATSSLDGDLPDLLFLQEKDLLLTLRNAANQLETDGTLALHQNSSIDAVDEHSDHHWSAQLKVQNVDTGDTGQSVRDYHLVIAADGMNSKIRQKYGGYMGSSRGEPSISGGESPLELNDLGGQNSSWLVSEHAEATGVQDRQYTVFRGNSPLSMEELGIDKSFQTWGEGKSMRFATVPLPGSDGAKDEQQVWFITIDDESIINEDDPQRRRTKLVEAFADWHDPIAQIVQSTPADEILMERALAHKHSMAPISNFSGVVAQTNPSESRTLGSGPAIVFVGDSFMTVDPILAQGFTIGMEGAAALHDALLLPLKAGGNVATPNLAFCPHLLRQSLWDRHNSRISRLIHLLRATELVQALGQPTSGTLMGGLSRDILRPLMRVAPDFIKRPIFNFMLLYSLGLTSSKADKSSLSK